MSKKLILLILIILSGIFISLEYYFQPPKIIKIKPLEKKNQGNQENNVNFSIENNTSSYFIKEEDFTKVKIFNVKIVETKRNSALFHRINIDTLKDGFEVISVVFEKNKKIFLKVYEFHPQRETTSTKIFNIIYHKLKQSIQSNEQDFIDLNQTNLLETKSFYFNDRINFPEMVFLTIKFSEKILSFEYKKEHHKEIQEVIKKVLSK